MSLAWEAGKGSWHVVSSRVDWVQAGSLGEKARGARGLGWEHSNSRPEPPPFPWRAAGGGGGAAAWYLEAGPLRMEGLCLAVCGRPASRAGLWSQQGHRTGSGEALLSGFRPLPPRPAPAQPRSLEYKGARTVLISHSSQATSLNKAQVISSSNHRPARFLYSPAEGSQRPPSTAASCDRIARWA